MKHTCTDDEWDLLRQADPDFQARWSEIIAESGYDPAIASASIGIHFGGHVVGSIVHENARYLSGIWTALESLYSALDEQCSDFILTAGFLEYLIAELEERGIALEPIWKELGPRSRKAWAAAYAYTHSGETWNRPNASL